MIDHTRHMGIFDASDLSVALIGAGGIGALTAISLGKMGIRSLYIIDDDDVDTINLATQFHRISDVGLHKAHTVARAVEAFSSLEPSALVQRIEEDGNLPLCDIYISAVDSIKSRKGIWSVIANKYNEDLVHRSWYIDARMGAEVFEMFTVKMDSKGWYNTKISREQDGDFPDLPCTSKATIYTSCIAAGHISAAVRRIATYEQSPGFLQHDIINNRLCFLDM